MKLPMPLPLAVAVALLVPRPKPPEGGREESPALPDGLVQADAKVKQLRSLQARWKAGEPISLQDLRFETEAPPSSDALQKIREEVTTLQQEYESLSPEPEPQPAPEPQAARPSEEEPLPHPLVRPDAMRLGNALFRLGRYQDALQNLQGREDAWSAFLAACCLERMDRADEAKEAYKKLAEKYPESAAARHAAKAQGFAEVRSRLGKPSDFDQYISELTSELAKQLPENK